MNLKTKDDLDVKILSSKGQIRRLMDSLVWKDIIVELSIWMEALVKDYDDVSDLVELGRIQGRREAVNRLILLPANFLRIKEMEERTDDSRRDETE
jgi:hypothetical protein